MTVLEYDQRIADAFAALVDAFKARKEALGADFPFRRYRDFLVFEEGLGFQEDMEGFLRDLMDVPEDAVLVGILHNWDQESIVFRFAHPSFPFVPVGMVPEREWVSPEKIAPQLTHPE